MNEEILKEIQDFIKLKLKDVSEDDFTDILESLYSVIGSNMYPDSSGKELKY